MRLIIPLTTFEEKCDSLATDGNNLIQAANVDTHEKLSLFHSDVAAWDAKSKACFQKSFEPEDNDFYKEYLYSYQSGEGNRSSMPMASIHNEISTKVQAIISIKDFVKISDLIINPENPELNKRKEFAIAQKEELLLTKLYSLYPKGKFYSVRNIFEYNGIAMNSSDDDIKICEPLKQIGDIELLETPQGITAKLTESGVKIVEKSFLHINQDPTTHPSINAEAKFNAIITELNNSGIVQDIVFEEINDLRQLIYKLTQKQWKEVVLGKLVDLGVQQSVKNDTLKLIYEKLTNEKVVFE